MIASHIKSGVVLGLLALLALPADAQTPPPSDSPASQFPVDGRDASFLPPTPLVPSNNEGGGGKSGKATEASSSAVNPVSAGPPTAAPTTAPANITGAPVESSELRGIDPESIGILAPGDGGLGAAMWKGTPRELVERLLPMLPLPAASPALNDLARRLLLTIADVPEGKTASGPALTSLRIERLVALGDANDAWNLALLAQPGQVDETTLRLTAEAALIGGGGEKICTSLPNLIRDHKSPDWQKLLVVCQLRTGDVTAAQLGLDVLHAQNVKDDTFFQLAERNIIGGVKLLPRSLTPLKPLNMALLLLASQPLPPELYSRPGAALIPSLLQTKTHDDAMRLSLAERAAAQGVISGAQLAAVYRDTTFPPGQLALAPNTSETGARQRALLYQAALAEKDPQKRLNDAVSFVQGLGAAALNGAMSQTLVTMIGDIPATGDYAAAAPSILRIFIMANEPKEALGWLNLARQAAAKSPDIAARMQEMWPLIALSGLEADSDYSQAFNVWLATALKDADPARREWIGGILLLLDAAGYTVQENALAQVVDFPATTKRTLSPPAVLLERLRTAGAAGRRGETVLLALALAGNGKDLLLPAVETVRALRLTGLTKDALAVAREEACLLLTPPEAVAKP